VSILKESLFSFPKKKAFSLKKNIFLEISNSFINNILVLELTRCYSDCGHTSSAE
jgi:hypothetical protein